MYAFWSKPFYSIKGIFLRLSTSNLYGNVSDPDNSEDDERIESWANRKIKVY